jgi:hypothetical protein
VLGGLDGGLLGCSGVFESLQTVFLRLLDSLLGGLGS